MSEIKFVMPEDHNTVIKVVGVGGGGCNAVNHMYNQGIVGVKFVVCNTDAQALNQSKVPLRVQLGPNLTGGRGAGAKPDIGKEATHESLDELKEVIGEDTQMLFVTAGMGGGTGTGGAPVVAQKAREMGILTVGIVTTPFDFEGPTRMRHAKAGIEEMRKYVDTLVVINNNRVNDLYSSSTFTEAYAHADDVLVNAAKSIAEIITVTGVMNVDFADVCTVMRESGVAIMGSASATGEDRASRAVVNALNSPLLNDNNIRGAKDILINIRYGDNEVRMEEVSEISKYVQHEAGEEPNIILGVGPDTALHDEIMVTVLATGFEQDQDDELNFETGSKVVTNKTDDGIEQSKTDSKINVSTIGGASQNLNVQPVVERPVAPKTTTVVPPPVNVSPPESDVIEVTLGGPKPEQDFTNNGVQNELQNDHQQNFEFRSQNQPMEQKEEPKIRLTFTPPPNDGDRPNQEEEQKLKSELLRKSRRERLSQFTENNYEQADINELEKQPAYRRKQNFHFVEVPDEKAIHVSRYVLNKDDEDEVRIKRGNSYIHDNID